jgi:protein farnesyltransferase subunit beta
LIRGLRGLPSCYQSLDASRPWLCYWVINALDVIGSLAEQLASTGVGAEVVSFLTKQCQHHAGGFQGGPGQLPHLAPSYAATNALMAIGTVEAYQAVNRQGMYDFLMSMKTPVGAFKMQENGEIDVRATYCAIAIASVYNLLSPELIAGVPEYLAACQGFDGGIGGEPGNEPHGGYSFCGLAAAAILDSTHLLDLPRLLHWAVHRQMSYEGGFQGRTNKLVDSCYSFWCGSLFPMLQQALPGAPGALFSRTALLRYILVCAQDLLHGGFRDKPSTRVDFYHTCYALNGLAIAVHAEEPHDLYPVRPLDPRYGVCADKVQQARAYFASLPLITQTSGIDAAVFSRPGFYHP